MASAAAASASAPEEPQILINTETKLNKDFQIQLANMAYADSLHDFGHAGLKFDETTKKIFDKGLPVEPNSKWDEEKTLNSVLQNLDMKTVGDTLPVPFSVGFSNKPLFNYLAKCYQIRDDKEDPDFGKNFVEKMELGGEGRAAAFIVDFNQHGFLEKLKRGQSAEGFEIYYLMTPEVVNDPAGKSNVYGDVLFGANNANTGVKMVSYVGDHKDYIHYLKFQPDYQQTDMFFSNYDFRLSPIQTVITKQKAEKLITSLNVSQPERPNLVANIEDSKGENSINTIIGYLKKIISSFFGKSAGSAEFNFNTKIQQKRGGDWFQALSCLDARNRQYKEVLPNPGVGRKLPDTCPVYFVSHDRIAVAYALLIGANVIYLDYYKKVFVFKNNADPTVKSSGKPIEQIILENIQRKWTPDALDVLKQTGEGYSAIKTNVVNRAFKTYEQKCNEFIASLLEAPITSAGVYQEKVKRGLIMTCVEAVRYAFIKTTLINIEDEMALLTAFDTSNKDSIMALNKAINAVNSIQEKFGKMAKQDATMSSSIEWWIGANVTKLDVYKLAAHIFEDEIDKEVDFAVAAKRLEDRLVTIADINNNTRKTDKYIYLAFLQHSLGDDDRKPFQQMISVLTEKTKEYFVLVSPNADVHVLRGGRIAPNVLFYNLVANLIYEANVFIGVAETVQPKIIEVDDLLILEASDEALMMADFADIQLFFGVGKHSNDTIYARDFALRGGGGDYTMFNAKERQRPGLINDMSNRQVVWTLLANTMLESLQDLDKAASESAAKAAKPPTSQAVASPPTEEPPSESAEKLPSPPTSQAVASPPTEKPPSESAEKAAKPPTAKLHLPPTPEKNITVKPPSIGGAQSRAYLVPTYMIASVIIATHDNAKLFQHPDKENYNMYYGFVKSLLERGEHPFAKHLYVFFFTSHASNLITNELKTFCPVWMLLLNDVFANAFMGRVILTPVEEQRHRDLIAEPAFKQFIKDCLMSSVPIDSIMPLYQTLSTIFVKSRSSSSSSRNLKKSLRQRQTKKVSKKVSKTPGNKRTKRVLRNY